jgi:hypothetical protein
MEKAAKAAAANPGTAQSELEQLTKKLAEQTAEISKRREVRSTKEEGTPAYVEANALGPGDEAGDCCNRGRGSRM